MTKTALSVDLDRCCLPHVLSSHVTKTCSSLPAGLTVFCCRERSEAQEQVVEKQGMEKLEKEPEEEERTEEVEVEAGKAAHPTECRQDPREHPRVSPGG